MVSGFYKYTYLFPPDHQVLHFAKQRKTHEDSVKFIAFPWQRNSISQMQFNMIIMSRFTESFFCMVYSKRPGRNNERAGI